VYLAGDGHSFLPLGGSNTEQLKRPTGLAFGRSNKLLYVVRYSGKTGCMPLTGRQVVFFFGARGEESSNSITLHNLLGS